jgi:hydrogenase maturation factor
VVLDGGLGVAKNVNIGGNLTVTGTTTFNGGTITLGDADTDNVVFSADVDSSITPDDDDTYDLGSTSKEWRDLHIDGIAHLDNVEAGIGTFSSNLLVSGISTFTGLIDANGGAHIDNLRLGVDADNDITTSSGNLTLDSTGGTVEVNDNLQVDGDVTMTNTSSNPQLALISANDGISEIQFGDGNDAVRGNILYRSGSAGDALCFHGYNNTERLRIASDGQATFDKGAPSSSNQVIGRFQAESSRALDIVWHDSGSLMGFDTPNSHSYIFKIGGSEKLRITNQGDVKVGSGVTIQGNGVAAFAGIVTAGGGFNIGIQSAGVVVAQNVGINTLNFLGAGNSITYHAASNTLGIDIAGSGGGGVSETETSVSTTSATSCGTFVKTSKRSAAVLAQITQGSNYQVGRYLLIHDGTTVTTIEESAIATGSMLGTFEGVINGSNVEFRVTMSSSSSATVTTKIDSISIPS